MPPKSRRHSFDLKKRESTDSSTKSTGLETHTPLYSGFKERVENESSETWRGLARAFASSLQSNRGFHSSTIDNNVSLQDKNKLIEKYRRFTSATMHRQLAAQLANDHKLVPHSVSIFACVLLADISGFTRLSSRLNAEELKHHINAYFSMLLGIVKKSGGDAIKFLGDAVLIIFPIEENSSIDIKATSVLMGSLCALQLTKDCGEYDRGEGVNRVSLSLHCAIGCGLLNCMCMGEKNRWEFLVAGEPLIQIGNVINDAQKGEVGLSQTAFEFINDKLETKRINNNYILTGRRTAPPTMFASPAKKKQQQSQSQSQSQMMTSGKVPVPAAGGGEQNDGISNNNNNNNNEENNNRIRDITNDECRQQLSRGPPAVAAVVTTAAINRSSSHNKDVCLENPSFVVRNHNQNNNINISINTNQNEEKDNAISTLTISIPPSKDHHPDSNTNNTNNTNTSSTEEESSLFRVGRLINYTFLDSSSQNDPFILLEKNPYVNDVRAFLHGYLIPDSQHGKAKKELSSIITTLNYYSPALSNKSNNRIEPVSTEHTADYIQSDSYLYSVLGYFVHDAVRSALDGVGASYLFELRNVTTLFIELVGLDADLNDGDVERPQIAMVTCLNCLERFGGSLRQYTVDDKGCVLIGAFGLPGSSHEDNSRRAVEAAMSIREALDGDDLICKQGIAEGRVFCGLVGNVNRCEYAMMGTSVNLAARLMGKCAPGEILVNETVYQSSQSAFVFQALPKVDAKGYLRPVPVYKPTERAYSNALLGVSTSGAVGFVGRQVELDLIRNALMNCQLRSHSFIIEGPPNVGKTRLAAEILKLVSSDPKLGLSYVIGTGLAAHMSTRYHVVRQIMEQIMDVKLSRIISKYTAQSMRSWIHVKISIQATLKESVDSSLVAVSMIAAIRDWIVINVKNTTLKLDNNYESQYTKNDNVYTPILRNRTSFDLDDYEEYNMLDLLPLLGKVMGVNAPDTSVTAEMKISLKQYLTEEMILRCVDSVLEVSNKVIIVDKLQWCDSFSLRVVASLVRRMRCGVFICTTRAIDDIHRMHYSNNLADGEKRQRRVRQISNYCKIIKLPPISAADVREIMERTIGARLLLANHSILSDVNIRSILERSNGSPLHVSILATGMKNALTTGKFTDVEDLPEGSDNLVISRYDKLSQRDQVSIKTASVIGVHFTVTELTHALKQLGMFESRQAISDALNHFVAATLVEVDSNSNGDDYSFSTRYIQKSIYNLMLESQRQNTHAIMGEYFERRYLDDEVHFQDVVHHYSLSNSLSKKCFYLQRFAVINMSEHANARVYRSFGHLVKISTGCTIENLLEQCLNKSEHSPVNHSIFDIFTSCFQRNKSKNEVVIDSYKPKAAADDEEPKSRRWLVAEDFCMKIIVQKDMVKLGWNRLKVSSWIATMGINQFMLGNFMESNNLIQFCLYNFGIDLSIDTTTTTKTTKLERHSLDTDVFLSMMRSLEFLVVLFLMRGLSEKACTLCQVLTDYFDRHLTRQDLSRSMTDLLESRSLRVRTLHTISLLASSWNESERHRATSYMTAVATAGAGDLQCDDVWLQIFRGVERLSRGEIAEGLDVFESAIQQSNVDGDRVARSFAEMGKAWCAFLCGKVEMSENALDNVLAFASAESHVQLHVWALELHIFLKALVRDFDSVDEDQRLIRSLQRKDKFTQMKTEESYSKKDNFSAPTSAVVAFSMTMNRQYERAYPYAAYSCSKLMAKRQGSALGGIYLFCSIYALLDIYENRINPKKGTNNNNTNNNLNPNANANSNAQSYNNRGGGEFSSRRLNSPCASPLATPRGNSYSSLLMETDKQTGHNRKVLEMVKLSLDSFSQHSQRFPCLMPLFLTLTTRLYRIEGVNSMALIDLDIKLKNLPEVYTQDIFSGAYLHLQRALFCDLLNQPYTFLNKGDSRVIARGYFSMLGAISEDLSTLGDPSSKPTKKAMGGINEWDSADEDDFDDSKGRQNSNSKWFSGRKDNGGESPKLWRVSVASTRMSVSASVGNVVGTIITPRRSQIAESSLRF
eukprot:gene7424-15167_t